MRGRLIRTLIKRRNLMESSMIHYFRYGMFLFIVQFCKILYETLELLLE